MEVAMSLIKNKEKGLPERNVLVGKREVKRPLERPRNILDGNIKTYLSV
jgi:hypothetical protein